jgi:hypothetical protein
MSKKTRTSPKDIARLSSLGKKRCSKCRQDKWYHSFWKNKLQKDGHEGYCIPCKQSATGKRKRNNKQPKEYHLAVNRRAWKNKTRGALNRQDYNRRQHRAIAAGFGGGWAGIRAYEESLKIDPVVAVKDRRANG